MASMPSILNSPRPIRVYTLGTFAVEREGDANPVLHGRCADLLKAIVALGPGPVSIDQLAAALWNLAEGDAAHNALEVTVHRLRKSLGAFESILVHDRRIRLAPDLCWVDCYEFEASCGQSPASQSFEDAQRAVALYRGALYQSEAEQAWMLVARARLHNRFVRTIERIADLAQADGAKALAVFRHALTIEPLNEAFQLGLFRALVHAGRIAEALDTYRRFENLTRASTGIAPSNHLTTRIAELVPCLHQIKQTETTEAAKRGSRWSHLTASSTRSVVH